MNFSDKDILLASLLGSKIVETVPRLSLVEKELSKRVGIPIPFLPFKNDINIEQPNSDKDFNNNEIDIAKSNAYSEADAWQNWEADIQKPNQQFFPLYVKRAGTQDPFFKLPYEPLISISGKNNIAKRSIAKAPKFIGTIKEHWSQDDYQITITGALFGENEQGNYQEAYPKADFEKLKSYCISPTGLQVECDFFQQFGINFIVVEEFNFPFSKGENVQGYDIKALSDFATEFLLEIKD